MQLLRISLFQPPADPLLIYLQDLPSHVTGPQRLEYIKSYAKHFDLNRNIELKTSVKWVKRNPEDTRWRVCSVAGGKEDTRDFDKIVFCTGLSTVAIVPKIEGSEQFKGDTLHVQAFKRFAVMSRGYLLD